jgi:hypothetical protein
VIDKASAADLRAGVDFNSSERAAHLRKHPRRKSETGPMQPVSQPMKEDCVKAWIAEENLDRTLGGGISAEDRIDLFPEGLEHV